MPEETIEIPPGYALVGKKKTMGANMQLPRFDRQNSMFQSGRDFQPASSGGMGQVRLRIPVQNSPFIGQMGQQQTTTPGVNQQPPPTGVPPENPPKKNETPISRRPAMRIAWGRLKKMDAQQLSDTLADIVARMKAKGIPPGMVGQIQARLASFAASAPTAAAEVEITQQEVEKMDQELLLLEDAEAKDASASSATPWLIAIGAALGLGLLIDWMSD